MSFPAKAILVLLALVCVNEPAYAQISSEKYTSEVAACMVKKSEDVAYQYIETMPQHETNSIRRSTRSALSRCVSESNMIAFNGYLLAFKVAEVLFKKNYASFNGDVTKSPALEKPVMTIDPDARLVEGYDQNVRVQNFTIFANLVDIGECIVRRNPTKSSTYLNTLSNSGDESRVGAELHADLAGCLTVGTPIPPISAIRGAMALAYVRMARVIERGAH